ncbi:hypothetical protein [Bdellovibrio bacteriovorus]|nr:hypothetical protein [Bdellovibrio bacteriovorus]
MRSLVLPILNPAVANQPFSEWAAPPIEQFLNSLDASELTKSHYASRLQHKEAIFFTDPNGDAYARVNLSGQKEVWPTNSEEFRTWLGSRSNKELGKFPTESVMREVVAHATGRAKTDGIRELVFNRVAGHGRNIYIDMADKLGRFIEITPSGYAMTTSLPNGIWFTRSSSMLPLPAPTPGGSINDLRKYVNLKDEKSWQILLSWILGSLNPEGPFPILMINGGPGTAKSTSSEFIKRLIDPTGAPLRNLTKNERDLMILGKNSWIMGFDNVSYIKDDVSDMFCRIATGGGFSTRKLYTDAGEKIFFIKRPCLFNGIPDFFSTRSDLIDRSLHVTLKPILEKDRKLTRELEREFQADHGKMLGAICQLLSKMLFDLPSHSLQSKPRMADFAHFVSSAEPHLGWSTGTVVDLMRENRADAESVLIENCVYSSLIIVLASENWSGSASELLEEIEDSLGEDSRRLKGVPQSASALSSSLRRYAPAFRSVGVHIDCDGKTSGANSRRFISISLDSSADIEMVRQARQDSSQYARMELRKKKRADLRAIANKKNKELVPNSTVLKDILMSTAKVESQTSKANSDERNSPGSPECFGHVHVFDPSSEKCVECPYEHACLNEIERGNAKDPQQAVLQ